MFFDPTKGIPLDNKHQKIYGRLQIGLYCFFLLAVFFFSYLTLFPTQELNFSFSMLTANKGNVLNPRTGDGTNLTDGTFPGNNKILFDFSLVGTFSKTIITFQPKKQSPAPENETVSLRKSYQAFLYPEGDPLGFPDGALLKNSAKYYIVSDQKLRQFSNEQTLSSLGFSSQEFLDISTDELGNNQPGEIISERTTTYPAASLFQIGEEYYRMKDGQTMEKFLSPGAFLSRYPKNWAIAKDAAFLKNYSLAPDPIGFADGTLISYANSVYIASGTKLYPIGDPDIFINQGYAWSDVKTVTGDEFSFYSKVKLFTLTSPHPDGTIFHTTDSNEWYLIRNNQKHRLSSEKAAKSWLGISPISVEKTSLEPIGNCGLAKNFWNEYACQINFNETDNAPGYYYEYSLTPHNTYGFNNLNVRLAKNITKQNLKISLINMIQRIKARFGLQSASQ